MNLSLEEIAQLIGMKELELFALRRNRADLKEPPPEGRPSEPDWADS